MAKKIYPAVVRVGRATVFCVGLAVIVAVVLGMATTALAGTGVGAVFNLGQINTVDKISQLVGSTNNAMLRVDNNNTGTGATALVLQVEPGKAPMKVNSANRVNNLNADKVDGLSASEIRGARAYARVINNSGNTPPSFDAARTSGFTAVTRSDTGVYCLTPAAGISATNRPSVVSVDWNDTEHPEGNASAMHSSFGFCSSGQFEVRTERQSVVDGVLQSNEANNIGFTIIVP